MNTEKKKKIIKSFLNEKYGENYAELWKNTKYMDKDGEPTSWLVLQSPWHYGSYLPTISIDKSADGAVNNIMAEYSYDEEKSFFCNIKIEPYKYKGNKYYIAYN